MTHSHSPLTHSHPKGNTRKGSTIFSFCERTTQNTKMLYIRRRLIAGKTDIGMNPVNYRVEIIDQQCDGLWELSLTR